MADNFLYVQAQPFTLYGSGAIIGDTSIILTTFTDIDGSDLTMANFGTVGYLTIDPGNGISEEQISFSGVTQNTNGTATLTGVKNVLFIAPYTETSGLFKTHTGGAIVVASNTSGFYNKLTSKSDDETITGTWTFTNPNYPRMDTATPAPTADEQLATKKYVDDTAIAGAPDASTTVKGITKLSVAPASPTNPIAVGTNDGRIPTQSENDALVGTSGTPSSSNKYVTNDDTATTATASKVARRLAGGNITVVTESANNNTTNAASTAYVDTAVATAVTTLKNGVGSISSTDGSTTTITHSLGVTPKRILFFSGRNGNAIGTSGQFMSQGVWDASGQNCIAVGFFNTNNNGTQSVAGAVMAQTQGSGGSPVLTVAVSSVNSSTFLLTATNPGGGVGNMVFSYTIEG